MINDDPHVHSSVMFGRGKFQNGILVEPAEDFAIDPMDLKKVEEYRNKIWCGPICALAAACVTEMGILQADYRARECVCSSALSHFQGGLRLSHTSLRNT